MRRNDNRIRLSFLRGASGISWCLFFIALGCSPTIKSNISLPVVSPTAHVEQGLVDKTYPPYVFLSGVEDVRTDKSVAEFDGQKSRTADDVAQVVLQGLEKGLKDQGFLFSDAAPIVLAIEVHGWKAVIESGFSDQVRADAQLFLEVIDPGSKRVYSGTYKGHAMIEAPGIDSKDVRSVLKTSMNEAINQIILDTQLMRLLASY